MIGVEDFQQQAADWLATNRAHAPRDYGAICPPDLVEPALDWQRRLTASGFAGIHWPGSTAAGAHGGAQRRLAAGVRRGRGAGVFNMVGYVLAGGALMGFGTPEQLALHLLGTLDADHVWCQLFSEPGAGWDLGSFSPARN